MYHPCHAAAGRNTARVVARQYSGGAAHSDGLRPSPSGRAPKPVDRLPEVILVDDRMTIEHRARSVPGELHPRALGHSGTHQVADGGAQEAVRILRAAIASCD
jgi:hypothetical protein